MLRPRPFSLCFPIIFFIFSTTLLSPRGDVRLAAEAATFQQWQLLQSSIGVSAMHMQLLNNDRVIIFDRTDFGKSNISLPNGKCRKDPAETALKVDCTAHSVEYDVRSNTFRPLMVQTDVWCSSGSVMPDGRLIQTGGFNDGERRVRIFSPCDGKGCDWVEIENGLATRRWYATNHILPDGRQIVIGGRRQFNYEFYPKTKSAPNVYSMPFLVETTDGNVENNLYPFVFLNVDGNLFIFANNRAILFDYVNNKVVRKYPTLPGGDPRSYPSTGSAVLLPIRTLTSKSIEAEVLVCGGAPRQAFEKGLAGNFANALSTCGRLKITDSNPNWLIETMPKARVMGDMVMLPNGDVLLINGAAVGTAGWELGRNPVLNPVVYRSDHPIGRRFVVQNPSRTPRMYHSSAILLRDGRVLVGGNNPHMCYNFTGVLFPTDLSLEAFFPTYLGMQYRNLRPKIVSPSSKVSVKYGQRFPLQFTLDGALSRSKVAVNMVAPPFTTHSFAMNQRLLVIGGDNVADVSKSNFVVEAIAPKSKNLAPAGYYMLFVVHRGIPSEGIWIHIQ